MTDASKPTRAKSRIIELDVFRGFAILGIFMVNILVMNVSFVYRAEWEAEQTGWLQEVAFFFLETFFYSKFFIIFSFLFGIGVALQIQRAKEKNKYSNLFFVRRFGSLFIFGFLHILFIWSGDILHLYGAYGFLLLLLFRCSTRLLLWTAVLIFVFPFCDDLFNYFVEAINFDHFNPLARLSRSEIIELKQNGTYLEGIQLRLKEYSYAMNFLYTGIGPVALSMMILGGYIIKKRILNNLEVYLQRIKVYLFSLLIIFTTFRFILLYGIAPNSDIEHGSLLSFLLMSLFYISDILLSLTYLWIIAYVLQKDRLKKMLISLRHVGRMAFTNYILQSIVGYIIMRTMGLYEFFNPFECILFVFVFFSFQVIISRFWLKYYRFGPLEWLWRCISYWKILPIRK